MYKHFFAVFEKYTSWSINALLLIYINSPFLNLGKAVIPLLKNAPFQMPLQQQKNLKDEINENAAINVQLLHPKTGERQQQLQSFASTLKKSKIYPT